MAKIDDDETVIAKVVTFLFYAGETLPLEQLGVCNGPRKARNQILSILKTSTRLSVCDRERVSLVPHSPNQDHPIQEPMRTSILCIFNNARLPLPEKKKELQGTTRRMLSELHANFNFEVFLADILYFGYVSVNKGLLEWNTDRLRDLDRTTKQKTKDSSSRGIATESTPRTIASPELVPHDEWEFSSQDKWKLPDGTTCLYVKSAEILEEIMRSNPIFSAEYRVHSFVALDCEGIPGSLELVQIGHSSKVYVFDAQLIGASVLCQSLRPLLTSRHIVKVVHDLHRDAVALETLGYVRLTNVFDTQLFMEHHFDRFNAGFDYAMEKLGVPLHPSKGFMHSRMDGCSDFWSKRPLPSSQLEYSALEASCLVRAFKVIEDDEAFAHLSLLKKASEERARSAVANDGSRSICFDRSQNYRMVSAELLRLQNPAKGVFGSVHVVASETEDVINVLPDSFQERFPKNGSTKETSCNTHDDRWIDVPNIRDIVIDVARRPQCWVSGKRQFLCTDPYVVATDEDIQSVIDHLGEIGHDNRAGLNGKMHRFSVMRARDNSITGLTIRIGRSITGMAELLMDIVLGSSKSMLFVGVPGSGKTTVVREVTRLLAVEENVVVVDTSNEIGGDGVQPHKSIGLARRMMVESLEKQSKVMVECVQNHTPSCMVIDEIGRPKEVEAARTVRQRGVRIIASAHGDLRKLIGNKELNGLIGGLETVTMGDEMAKEEAKRKMNRGSESGPPGGSVSKTKTQRRSEPTFDVVVELGPRGQFLDWCIVHNVAGAVDDVLDGKKYKAERRFQNTDTGAMFMEYVKK